MFSTFFSFHSSVLLVSSFFPIFFSFFSHFQSSATFSAFSFFFSLLSSFTSFPLESFSSFFVVVFSQSLVFGFFASKAAFNCTCKFAIWAFKVLIFSFNFATSFASAELTTAAVAATPHTTAAAFSTLSLFSLVSNFFFFQNCNLENRFLFLSIILAVFN
jgi:hypothetical protein